MLHFFKRVQGWFSFKRVYEQAVRDAPKAAHFVEVGSFKGRSCAFMCVEIANSGKKIRFDCVDTWQGSDGNQKLMPEHMNGTMYGVFLTNTAPVRKLFTPIRMPSVEAADLYDDDSLDFVFIDADHAYKHVKADIEAWWPKVKAGGTFAGDDYHGGGVRKAVDDKFGDGVEDIQGSGSGRQWRIKK